MSFGEGCGRLDGRIMQMVTLLPVVIYNSAGMRSLVIAILMIQLLSLSQTRT